MVYSWPAGVYEPTKHGGSLEKAGLMELREEAGLECGDGGNGGGVDGGLVRLLSTAAGRGGAPQDKYQREKVEYFLCVDARKRREGEEGRVLDEEERIEVVGGVRVEEVKELVLAGVMQSNMMAASFMAIDRLEKMGYL